MIQNQIEIVTGRKGQGKSTLAYHRARLARRGVVIFDPNFQFGIGRLVHSGPELAEALEQDLSPVVYQPYVDVWKNFETFVAVVFTKQGISVLVDEASLLGSPQRIHPELDSLIRLGRTKELDIFLTAHRPQDLNGIVFSLADAYSFFHTTHPRDLERIEEFTNEAARLRVKELGPHQFLHWSVELESFYVNASPDGWREQIKPEAPEEDEIPTEEEAIEHGRN